MLGTRKIATPAQNTVAKQEKKVEVVLEKITENEKGKKIQTAALAAGIQHSLNQVTNPPVQVETAKVLNERVVSIIGSPHIDEINRIKATVDLLNSEVAEERKKGESLLALRDAEITKLQKEKSELKEKYDDEVENMTETAEKKGWLTYLNISHQIKNSPFHLLFRYTIFNISDYDARIYAYENDVMYASATPAFSSQGNQVYGMLKYRINAHWSAWLKYSTNELKIQVVWDK